MTTSALVVVPSSVTGTNRIRETRRSIRISCLNFCAVPQLLQVDNYVRKIIAHCCVLLRIVATSNISHISNISNGPTYPTGHLFDATAAVAGVEALRAEACGCCHYA